MFLGMDIYSWIAAIVIALIVTFLPITLPFKIVLAMVAMACFYFGRKYYHNHKNGGAETPSIELCRERGTGLRHPESPRRQE